MENAWCSERKKKKEKVKRDTLVRQTDSRNRSLYFLGQSKSRLQIFWWVESWAFTISFTLLHQTLRKASKLGDARPRQRVVLSRKTDRNAILDSLSHSHLHTMLAIDHGHGART